MIIFLVAVGATQLTIDANIQITDPCAAAAPFSILILT